jgi:chemotaxis protein MotB
VSLGNHREVVAERDRLLGENADFAKRVQHLEASNESLGAERVRLIEEIEDLRESQAALTESVADLERQEASLREVLSGREAEIALRTQGLESLRGGYQGLVADLESEVAAGQIEIERLREGLRLNVTDAILFDSGSARLKPAGQEVLGRVAVRLRELSHEVEVQGHTDNVPIQGALARRYPSNWELAAARATGVVRWLEEQGVDPARLTGVSFGANHPIAPNDSPEGRARNRRIEIRLLPASDEPTEPVPASTD